MATTHPPPAEPVTYDTAIHTLALSLALICPAIIALPPRRLDLMTGILGGTTLVSLNHLHSTRYGYGVLGRFSPSYRRSTLPPPSNPSEASPTPPAATGFRKAEMPTPKAAELQAQFQAAKAARERGMSEAEREAQRQEQRTLGEKVWYGEERREDWAAKRDREIREKFEEGKGIGDVIWEQVWEVWNWDKRGEKGEGGKEG
ncbi:Hypothetical protein D9617_14g077610 [Elsinoe fawcettii]|nr:Hypothetical protein D9617_14g077610 [Elsinoe fawcettii]